MIMRAAILPCLLVLSLLAPHGAGGASGGLVICGANGPVRLAVAGVPGSAPAAGDGHKCCLGLCAAAPAHGTELPTPRAIPHARILWAQYDMKVGAAPRAFHPRAPPFVSSLIHSPFTR